MAQSGETRPFVPVRFAVLTVSDTRSLEDDRSGATLAERIEGAGHVLAARDIVTDDIRRIRAVVRRWIDDPAVDVVITTGGTGFTGRDVTPEAVEPLFDKRMEGFADLFHAQSHEKIGTSTIQSRATAGLAKRPSSSACPVPPAPAAMPGTASWSSSSTTASHPVTSSRSCPASTSI